MYLLRLHIILEYSDEMHCFMSENTIVLVVSVQNMLVYVGKSHSS